MFQSAWSRSMQIWTLGFQKLQFGMFSNLTERVFNWRFHWHSIHTVSRNVTAFSHHMGFHFMCLQNQRACLKLFLYHYLPSSDKTLDKYVRIYYT